jgi:hypothetical protein
MKRFFFKPQCGFLGKDGDHNVSYATFVDGVQNVLIFADDTKIIEAASGVSLFEFSSR